jgi:hypothetical protein
MVRRSFIWGITSLIILLGTFSIARAQTSGTSCSAGYKVFFANGIWNSEADGALASLYATQALIGPRINNQPITYGQIFHSSESVGNLRTALFQKLSTDPSFAWASGSVLSQIVLDVLNGLPFPSSLQQFIPTSVQTALVTTITSLADQAADAQGIPGNSYYDAQVGADVDQYLAALNGGYQVLVVAHSQGNLYVDAAYHVMFAGGLNSTLQTSFAVVSAATPDTATVSTLGGKPAYVTFSQDLVIGSLQKLFPAVLGPTDAATFNSTADAGCFFSNSLHDCTGHQYLKTYLTGDLPFRNQILQLSQGLLSSLSAPPPGPSCVVIASLHISPSAPTVAVGGSVTLTVTATNATGYPVPLPTNLVWQSSDTVEASVTSGVVTGESPGMPTITVTDPSSGVQASVVVTVGNVAPPPPHVTVTLQATPTTVLSGQSAVLSWTSTNADSCAANGWTSSTSTSGSVSTGPLSSSASYTITCTNATTLDSATATQTVTVTLLPTVVLTATPANIVDGASSTLTWTSSNAASCAAVGGWTNSTATSGSASTGALFANATFKIICADANGNQSVPASATVTVGPVPTVTLTANPTTVTTGGSSSLSWSSQNAASCTASGGWTSSTATSGTASTGALTATTTYTMTCRDASGNTSAPASATVSVTPAAMVNLSAYPESVISGDTSTISWTSVGATTCTAVGGWTTSNAPSGLFVTGPLTANTTFTMTCADANGTQSAPATVQVTVGTNLPTLYITAAPSVVPSGSNTVISWVSSNATSCSAVGGWTSSTAVNNSVTVGPINNTTKYTLTCTGAAYSVTTSTIVQVSDAPGTCVPAAGATTCAVTLYNIPDPAFSGISAPLATVVTVTDNLTGVSSTESYAIGASIYDNVNGPPLNAPACNPLAPGCPPLSVHQAQMCSVDGKWTPLTYNSLVSTQAVFFSNQTGCTGQPRHFDIITGYALTADGHLTATEEEKGHEDYDCTAYNGTKDKGSDDLLHSVAISLRDGSGSASITGSSQSSGMAGPTAPVSTNTSTSGSESWPAESNLPPQLLNTGIDIVTTNLAAGQSLPQACTVGTP